VAGFPFDLASVDAVLVEAARTGEGAIDSKEFSELMFKHATKMKTKKKMDDRARCLTAFQEAAESKADGEQHSLNEWTAAEKEEFEAYKEGVSDDIAPHRILELFQERQQEGPSVEETANVTEAGEPDSVREAAAREAEAKAWAAMREASHDEALNLAMVKHEELSTATSSSTFGRGDHGGSTADTMNAINNSDELQFDGLTDMPTANDAEVDYG